MTNILASTIVQMLLEDSNREQCLKVLDCPDGDLRAHATARLKVLDNIQRNAQETIYRETPPGMVLGFELRDWWYEKQGNVCAEHIDFNQIADNKKHEWYAYADHIVETKL